MQKMHEHELEMLKQEQEEKLQAARAEAFAAGEAQQHPAADDAASSADSRLDGLMEQIQAVDVDKEAMLADNEAMLAIVVTK